ncbi:hypothetical protein EMIT0P171_20376 [Pseudomonas sp. IT-P171]
MKGPVLLALVAFERQLALAYAKEVFNCFRSL